MQSEFRPVDPDDLSPEQLYQVPLVESGWLSFVASAAHGAYDAQDERVRDAYFAGASLVLTLFSQMAAHWIDEDTRNSICDQIDRELAEFNAGRFDIRFTPYIRD